MHEHEEYLIHGDGYTFCLFPGCDFEGQAGSAVPGTI
jgi:hypothetical protein